MRDAFHLDVTTKALEDVLKQRNLKLTKEDGLRNPVKLYLAFYRIWKQTQQ